VAKHIYRATLIIGYCAVLSACGGYNSTTTSNTTIEDSSASGAAASAVGGALADSSANGSVSQFRYYSPKAILISPWLSAVANASNASCPTLVSGASSGANTCASITGGALLYYSSCSFGSSTATWSGYMDITLANASSTVDCIHFPTPTTDTLMRQFVNLSGTQPSTGTRTSASGPVVTMDDTTATIIANYEGDHFDTTGYSTFGYTPFGPGAAGGGKEVVFDGSGKRTSVTVVEQIKATAGLVTLFKHTVAGTVNISESGSGSASEWTASAGTVTSGSCTGGITVYHDLVEMAGNTCFANVKYNTTCCTPVSGTITTTFSKSTQSPTNAITTAMAGKSESLTFNGCGSATWTTYAGSTIAVSTNYCF